MNDYETFIESKSQLGGSHGFDPVFMPDFLFDFQKALVEWAVRKGRAALFCDCGLGKGPMALTFAENGYRKIGKPSLIIAPLAVAQQFEREGEKFGVPCVRSKDGTIPHHITVTNYERLSHFNPDDFGCVVCDESSILKSYSGATRNAIIAFMAKTPYRLLCSATPSPNDHTELGNSVEALSIMRRVEMLSKFFIHDSGDTGTWRLKGHGMKPFWRFVASWARAVRMPSDIGFENGDFVLPKMETMQHTLKSKPLDGQLFATIAMTLNDQRAERRETMDERCEKTAGIANEESSQFLAWCALNAESERLAKEINGAVEITGSMSDDEKEENMTAFATGQARALVTKPDIAGFGINLQNCHRMSFFPSHSHEQFYQSVRRCWRFGQKNTVRVHIVTTEAESAVLSNLERKERMADEMFAGIVRNMSGFYREEKSSYAATTKITLPSWIV